MTSWSSSASTPRTANAPRCTLYTLEVHIHYLHEVKAADELAVHTSMLDSDRKRIHARGVFTCARLAEPVAVAEAMLLHVQTRRGARERAVSVRGRGQAPRPAGAGRAHRHRVAAFAKNRNSAAIEPVHASNIRRLIAPRSIALIGAGAWTDAVAAGCATVGFDGTIWRVHPTKPSTAATTYYRSVEDLPGSPDAAFLAVPNHEVPGVAAALARRAAPADSSASAPDSPRPAPTPAGG